MRMETVTFPNPDVQKYITEHFVTVKYESGRDSEQFSRFGIFTTPTIFILDANGDELYRIVGHFTPEDFTGQLISARQIIGKL
ncbi:MAG: thioredoxin family protein [Nitrospiraceae bacterium]|nr:MAG: thioredoxin family protein [Nitrospiraceae bacterium]